MVLLAWVLSVGKGKVKEMTIRRQSTQGNVALLPCNTQTCKKTRGKGSMHNCLVVTNQLPFICKKTFHPVRGKFLYVLLSNLRPNVQSQLHVPNISLFKTT